MVKKGIVEWFKSHVGLPNGRFDIRKKLNDSHVSVEDYEAIWGKRKANNGFKLESDAPSNSLIDSTMSPNVKITEG